MRINMHFQVLVSHFSANFVYIVLLGPEFCCWYIVLFCLKDCNACQEKTLVDKHLQITGTVDPLNHFLLRNIFMTIIMINIE